MRRLLTLKIRTLVNSINDAAAAIQKRGAEGGDCRSELLAIARFELQLAEYREQLKRLAH